MKLQTKIYRYVIEAGIDLNQLLRFAKPMFSFGREYRKFKVEVERETPEFPISACYPRIWDSTSNAGTASGDYFHQDLYVAQRIFKSGTKRHVDVGSRIDGFVAHVATFMPIEIFDIRPVESKVNNIIFRQADMMDSESCEKESCESLSCLHALEHFGLGRYGDPLDSRGHLKGFESLHRLLKPNGVLYFSVPIGTQRIEFNAHRVFSLSYLLSMIEGRFTIEEFSYVDERGDLHVDVPLNEENVSSNLNCRYGCGIFILRKTV